MTLATEAKAVLKILGFTLEQGTEATWVKSYSNHNNYKIKVDIGKEAIDYGKSITVVGKSASNLRVAENLVVLECVNRILGKGYKPKNIFLEKTWATGHGTSGRLDILVTRDNGSAYLMIECKTHGTEFDKELKRVLKEGGQIFTYFQQDKNADILMLYSSECDKGKIEYRNEIIKIEEDYRQTGNVKDFYDRWNKLPKSNGVFESWVKPYDFQSKALTPKNLKDIKNEDSSFIFNQFLEILRHNVVSDKPNAFNKIFTLFLCKIYDEKVTKPSDELAFQWFYTPYTYEGINYPPDDNISFQKRLTDLYRKGMKEFLDKAVTDISDAEFEKKYGKLDSATKKQILDEFTEIRLKKNNEFAIKEVFNDDSFEENAKVVKEVVELLQGYKIRYTKKQQYLSDFFELLLTTGLKQESGQFFTPVPIAQYIIKSIPLDRIVNEKLEKGTKDNLLPTIIDYAAGSGHFITESMHEVQRIIDKLDPNEFIEGTAKKIASWKTDHFDWANHYVYGIEKDYRLVKVGKVGCYLHGDGLAQIVHSDGLGNFLKTEEYKGFLKKADKDFPKENKQFDIVISNPPYSVAAFRNNARKFYTEADFDLYDKLTDQSSEIECLFIERTKQLLKDGGIAGLILPSSILSNSGIYTKARELLLRYFEIIAFTELGSNTFMATGTNTVTLFLRRRNNYDATNICDMAINAISDKKDISINGIEKPISKYIAHVWEGLTLKDYYSLISKKPTPEAEAHDLYKEYRKKAKFKSNDDFWKMTLALENEKFFHFVLAYPQKVVLIKSGDKTEEKEFLGYEFSNRRGSEGIHPIGKGKTIEECTKLFDPEVFDNPQKASTYVYNAFLGIFTDQVHEDLKENVFYSDLVDLISFDRSDFEKTFSLSVKKKAKFETIWMTEKLVALGDVAEIRKGTSITKDKTSPGKIPVVAGGKEPAYFHSQSNREKDIITISASGAHAGFVNYFEVPIFASDCNTVRSKDERKISSKLMYYFLKAIQTQIYDLQRGQAQPHVYSEDLEKVKIPDLSKDIQEKILSDIEEIETKEIVAVNKRIELENAIAEKFKNVHFKESSLGDISVFKNGLNYSRESKGEVVDIIGVKDFQNRFTPDIRTIEKIHVDGQLSDDYTLQTNDILVVRSNGSVNLVGRFLFIDKLYSKTSFSGFTIRIRPNLEIVDSKYLCHFLKQNAVREKLVKSSSGANIKSLNQRLLASIKIPLPPLTDQKNVTAEIDEIRNQLADIDRTLEQIDFEKSAVIRKHVKED